MLEKLKPQQTKHIVQVMIGLSAIFLFWTLRIFIDAFLGAVIIYVLFSPMMYYLSVKKKWNRGLSAIVVIFTSLFAIIIPSGLLISYVVPKLFSFMSDPTVITNAVKMIDEKMKSVTGMQLFSPENIQNLSQNAAGLLTGFLGTTFGMFGDVVIMYFMLYYMLISLGKMQKIVEDYVPFSHTNILKFSRELQKMTYANALGTPLIALVQGAAAAIGYWIFGIKEPFFWGIMTGLFSFVPAVGTLLIWGPISIIELAQGNTWQGLGVLFYSLIFIVLVENLIRISLQKKMADVHPLVTMLGFIIGIALFGLPGIIFGPLLLSWFLLLLEIYKDEFINVHAKKTETIHDRKD